MLLSMMAVWQLQVQEQRHHSLDIFIRRLPVADTVVHGAAATAGGALRTVNRK
jgi:hypothetical protein